MQTSQVLRVEVSALGNYVSVSPDNDSEQTCSASNLTTAQDHENFVSQLCKEYHDLSADRLLIT